MAVLSGASLRALLSFALLGCLTLAQPAASRSWPLNHELNAPFVRTLIYASHMEQGDLLPIWSSTDNARFGSPEPAFYHKLFYLLTAPVYLACASLKASVLVVVAALLVLGAFGMYRLLLFLGASNACATFGGLLLVAANYTVTNWLTRGAMAEFTAAMIVPWALLAACRSVKRGTLSLAVGLTFALLLLSHLVLGYFFALLAASAAGLFMLFGRIPRSLFSPRSLAMALLPVVVLVGPYVYAIHAFQAAYDLTSFIPPAFSPENQFQPLQNYFWQADWQWGTNWIDYTVQLDSPLLALAGVSMLALLRPGRKDSDAPIGEIHSRLLALLLFLCMALQTPWSVFVYETLPGASYLQFPWRLLGILTPIAIVLAVLLAEGAFAPTRAKWIVGMAAAWAIAICGAFAPIRYGSLPALTDDPREWFLGADGQFLPVRASAAEKRLDRQAVLERIADQGCTFDDESRDIEPLTLHYRLRCQSSAVLALPIFASPYHRVIGGRGRGPERCLSVAEKPALCAVRVFSGENMLAVRVPTLARVLGMP